MRSGASGRLAEPSDVVRGALLARISFAWISDVLARSHIIPDFAQVSLAVSFRCIFPPVGLGLLGI